MKQKQKKFDRVIPAGTATGIIGIFLLVCLLIVWKEQSLVHYVPANQLPSGTEKATSNSNKALAVKDDVACTPRYYEGDVRVHGWGDPQNSATGDVIMHVTKADAAKMPDQSAAYGIQSDMEVKIIDPTAVVRGELKQSTPQNPVLITIKGYAQVCAQPPLVSLQPAAMAFKEDSSGS